MGQERVDIGTRHASVFLQMAAASRDHAADLLLALVLTFVAGALNAGGFLMIGQYTSHMTGIVSAMADNMALGSFALALAGLAALTAFILGAALSAILINWARRHRGHVQYALPIALEALLLFGFSGAGSLWGADPWLPPAAVTLLCLVMGLQNATVTKLSGARIRTTHVTGIVTDIGIELGKLAYRNTDRRLPRDRDVVADRGKLRLLVLLLGTFFIGGLVGAICFSQLGYGFCLLLGALLLLISAPQFYFHRRTVSEP